MSDAAQIIDALAYAADRYVESGLEISNQIRSSMFALGDWWNNPPEGIDRVQLVKSERWHEQGGAAYSSCRTAGSIAARWPMLTRVNALDWAHHRVVAPLPDEQAIPLLERAVKEDLPVSKLRALVKQERRAERELELADDIEAASIELGHQLYGVIYIDPPWRFEPYSRESGMDRAADNHYPTMTQEQLTALEIPAADDCVIFCWATMPMLPDAIAFLYDHGFAYRTAYGWLKPGPGTGYWSQTDQLELLLVGTKGEVPAPAPGTQPPQVQSYPRQAHSKKPDAFAAMIEGMFPNVPKLEMFARGRRPGWDTWGAEAEVPTSDR